MGRLSYSKITRMKKYHLFLVEWSLFGSEQILSCPPSIQKHPFSKWWTIPIWASYPRYPSCPSLLIFIRVVTQEIEKQAKSTQESNTTYYNAHAHHFTEIGIGSNVAIQHPCTKLWDTYSVREKCVCQKNVSGGYIFLGNSVLPDRICCPFQGQVSGYNFKVNLQFLICRSVIPPYLLCLLCLL